MHQFHPILFLVLISSRCISASPDPVECCHINPDIIPEVSRSEICQTMKETCPKLCPYRMIDSNTCDPVRVFPFLLIVCLHISLTPPRPTYTHTQTHIAASGHIRMDLFLPRGVWILDAEYYRFRGYDSEFSVWAVEERVCQEHNRSEYL